MTIQEATPIALTADERAVLEGWVRAPKSEQRAVERARVVLLAAAGQASRAIARELGVTHRTVSKWRVRFARDRLDGLDDAPRSGKPKTYQQLRRAIDAFIAAYNPTAIPFQWRKATIHPKALAVRLTDLDS
jgi:hypothetical protein